MSCPKQSSYFIPYKKLVNAAAEWETTLGMGSFKSWIKRGYVYLPYNYWYLGFISSEICPIAWQAEYLNIGLGLPKNLKIISIIELIWEASSIYSPTWERAITAVYWYLQSELFNNSFIAADKRGKTYLSPTEKITLSIAPIPNLVV